MHFFKKTSKSSKAGDKSPITKPDRPRLGEIYTGKDWEPTSELDLSRCDVLSVEYTGSTEKFEPREHISRWRQLKKTHKLSLVLIIAVLLAFVGIFVVIGLMATGVIKVEDRNSNSTTEAKDRPLVNRDFAILPIETLDTIPPVQTSTSSSFVPLPTILPDVGSEATITPRELSSPVEENVLTSTALPKSSVVAASTGSSSVSLPKTTFVTRAQTAQRATLVPSQVSPSTPK